MKEKHSAAARVAVMTLLGFSCILPAHFYSADPGIAVSMESETPAQDSSVSPQTEEPSFCSSLMEQLSAPFRGVSRFLSERNREEETYVPSASKFNLMALPVEEGTELYEGTPDFSDASLMTLFRNHFRKNSWGARFYQELNSWDAAWISDIYRWIQLTPAAAAAKKGLPESAVLGHYDPSNPLHIQDDPSTFKISQWKNVTVQITDGDGIPCQLHSNARDILAMASVYTYYTGWTNTELFSAYIKQLWQASHHVQISISPVYFCDDCKSLSEEDTFTSGFVPEKNIPEGNIPEGKQESAVERQTAKAASPSDLPKETNSAVSEAVTAKSDNTISESDSAKSDDAASEPDTEETVEITDGKEKQFCPGHVDLQISLQITDFSNQNGLVQADAIGRQQSGTWKGWSSYAVSCVNSLLQEDWVSSYGLDPVPFSLGQPLSLSSIREYLKLLPEDIAPERKAVITCALRSVGKIPYYYGGKPSFPGLDGNNFASVRIPDSKGRVLSGLDCSGWVNWVYWTALGQRPSGQGTFDFVNTGHSISKEELKPGDLAIRLGADPHVVMFLAWNADGSMLAIHETAGGVNNVTVSSVPGNWPYYRSLLTP